MGRKSYHEHQIEEKENASQVLSKVKAQENDKATIYLDDHAHTIILVDRSVLNSKVSKLKKLGRKIKRIL